MTVLLAQFVRRSVLSFLAIPELGQPEMYLQWKDGLIVDGGFGAQSREFAQGFIDAFAVWVRCHQK